ncbi:MAG: O-antigen ligase family protein [Alphaproteobacteria bacterium]|nr:O-antigen ligase family protein [Alphaproteobacteria bacterium]
MSIVESLLLNIKKYYKEYSFFYDTSYLIVFVLLFSPFITSNKYPDSFTTIKWNIILLSTNIMFFFFLFKTKSIAFPKIPHISVYVGALILCMVAINSYAHNVPLFSYENTRRFIFWGAAIFYFNLFCRENNESFLKIEKVIFLSSLVFVLLALAQYILNPEFPPYLTFGNINLSSEFIGFSLAFQFCFLTRCWKQGETSWFLNILAALSLTYIYFTNCRSVMIGSVLIILFSFFIDKRMLKEKIKILFSAIIFIYLIRQLIYSLYPEVVFMSFSDKGSSFRWLLYTNTLVMIYNNPFGVGVGQFEFASLPYLGSLFPTLNEWLLFSTPHNEYLHYLSEDGVALSFLFFIFGLSFICLSWRDIKQIFIFHSEIFYFFIMLFIQALFQFPLLEPLPYVMTALMIGYFFSILQRERVSYKVKGISRVFLIGINFIATLIVIVSFSAKYISFNFPYNEQLNKFACSYGNRNWISCLNVSYSYLNKAEYDKAALYASKTLEWQPLNYQGMKLLGLSYLYSGQRAKACKLFGEYDALFQNQSSLHEQFMKECMPYFEK